MNRALLIAGAIGGAGVVGAGAYLLLTRPTTAVPVSTSTTTSGDGSTGTTSTGTTTNTNVPGPSGTASVAMGYVDGLSVQILSSTSIGISWSAAANATSYEVQINGTTVTTTSGLSYTASNLSSGTTYSVEVIPGNSSGFVDSRLAGQTILLPDNYDASTQTATYTSSTGQQVDVGTVSGSGTPYSPPNQSVIDELAALDATTDYVPGTSTTVGYYDPFSNSVAMIPPGGFPYSAVSGEGFTQAEYNAVMAGISQQDYVAQFGAPPNT